jgi:hypothetical protein
MCFQLPATVWEFALLLVRVPRDPMAPLVFD